MWPGNGDGESAKFWYAVLTELKNHGVKGGVFFMVCDRLKDLPDSIRQALPGHKGPDVSDPPAAQQFPLRTEEALAPRSPSTSSPSTRPPPRRPPSGRLRSSTRSRAEPYPAMIRLWPGTWTKFVPFLNYNTREPQSPLLHEPESSPPTPGPLGQ